MNKSLEILSPQSWASQTEPNSTPLTRELEEATRRILQAASARDWDHDLIKKHVTKSFTAKFEHSNGNTLDSWAAYVENHERIVAQNPTYRFEVLNTAADVDEGTGRGIIYALIKVLGHPENVQRESIVVMNWRRREGVWRCHKEKVIRGLHLLPDMQTTVTAPVEID